MSEAQKKQQIKRLEDTLKKPENRECFDCSTIHPRWASTNLGIFICMRCAGIHRGLGTHISKVKNVTLDVWEEHMIQNCENIGNGIAKDFYPMPAGQPRPAAETPVHTVERMIRLRYEGKGDLAANLTPQFRSDAGVNNKSTPTISNNGQQQQQQQQQQQVPMVRKNLASSTGPIIQGTVIQPPNLFGTNNNNNNENSNNIPKKNGGGLDDIFGGGNSNGNHHGHTSSQQKQNLQQDDIFGDFVGSSQLHQHSASVHSCRPHHHGHHGNHASENHGNGNVDIFGPAQTAPPLSFVPAANTTSSNGNNNNSNNNNFNIFGAGNNSPSSSNKPAHTLVADPFASLAGSSGNGNNFKSNQQQQQVKKTAVDDLFA